MKSKLAIGTMLLGSAMLVACQILLGIDDTTVAAEASSSGVVGSSSSSSSGEPARCPIDPDAARPLGRLAEWDDGGTPGDAGADGDAADAADLTLDFALRKISIYEPDPTFGYDLDRDNTTDPAFARCVTTTTTAAVDGPGGRDNAAGFILATRVGGRGVATKALSDAIEIDIEEGKGTTLLRIEGYNGKADDDFVLLQVATSPGLDRGEDGGNTGPRWDGTDVWTLLPEDTTGVRPPWVGQSAANGYVRNHQLIVVQPGDTKFYFPVFTREIALGSGLFTATIAGGNGEPFRLDLGTTAGTADPKLVYETLRNISVLGTPVCRLGSKFAEFNVCAELMEAADIPSADYCKNLRSATDPCEHISLTFGFSAYQVQPVRPISQLDAGTVVDLCGPFDPIAECTR